MMPRSAQSSLSHWMTAGHGGRLEGHDFVEAAAGHDHAAGVLSEMSREVLDLQLQAHEMSHALVVRVEAGRCELRGHRLDVLLDLAEVPGGHGLGELVSLLQREAEGLCDLTRGGAIAIGDDVRGHGRAVRAVGLVDVLDDALALIARG